MNQGKDITMFFGNEIQECDNSLKIAVKARVRLLATELHEVATRYATQYDILMEDVTAHTVDVKYAAAGNTARRGYLTPSPIIHLLVHNLKKSKPLKAPPKSGNYFAYRLNAEGQLLCVDQYAGNHLSSREILVRDVPNTVYGLTFLGNGQPMLLLACTETFDDRGRVESLFEMKMPLLMERNLFAYEKYYYDGAAIEGTDVILQGIYGGSCRLERYITMGSGQKLTLMQTSSQIFTLK